MKSAECRQILGNIIYWISGAMLALILTIMIVVDKGVGSWNRSIISNLILCMAALLLLDGLAHGLNVTRVKVDTKEASIRTERRRYFIVMAIASVLLLMIQVFIAKTSIF